MESHKRTGKTLIPPAIHAMRGKLDFTSWMNDRLPEMLWAALIFASNERSQAFREFVRIFNFVAEHERKAELECLTLSGFAGLDVQLRKEIINVITANPATSKALSTLLMFDGLPARTEWEACLSNGDANLPLLMVAVGDTLFHQSQGATDCRWVWVMGVAAGGQMSVAPDLADRVKGITDYPYVEPGASEGGSVRAIEQALASMMLRKSEWSETFWVEAWEKSPCIQLVPPRQDQQLPLSTTRQGISEAIEGLESHWNQTHSTTGVDAKHDAVFGMAFFVLRILSEMIGIGISNGILARVGLRTIFEIRVNLKHLIDKNDSELWKRWREYGVGQAKLSSLKLDDIEEPPEYLDAGLIERIASEDLWEELRTIDIGHWASGDLRRISEESQLKDLYDQYYPWTSTYTHGMWGAIRESSFQTCGNPLHRLHRYPERQPLNDCLYDAVTLVDEILGHVGKEYPSFSHRLLFSSQRIVR
ncbi:MAG: hypothetical protein F4X65_06190 [Chloroflexi bacterium]|nr:hypothetical protein [Chloroflexota bacterium]